VLSCRSTSLKETIEKLLAVSSGPPMVASKEVPPSSPLLKVMQIAEWNDGESEL
jgi:hypothetical protein